jgi:hypothetical protein
VFFLITVFPDFTGMPMAEFRERGSRKIAFREKNSLRLISAALRHLINDL